MFYSRKSPNKKVDMQIFTFLSAALVLGAIPGQTNLFMISQGMSQSRQRVLATFCGVMLGNIIWILLSAFGISILIQKSPFAFDFLRFAGVAYLIYIGISVWRQGGKPLTTADAQNANLPFLKGMLSPLTNPKSLVFYITFLPQFVSAPEHFARDILTWGVAYLLIIAPFIFAYGFLGTQLLGRLQNEIVLSRLRGMIGGVLILTGVLLFWY
jgi:homoserine/homoserine lactone efflux protein